MTDVSESIVLQIVDTISKTRVGVYVLCLSLLIVVIFPIIKWTYPIIQEKKEKKKKQEEENKRSKEEEKEFRKNMNRVIEHLPELDTQVSVLASEVNSLNSLKTDLAETTETFKKSIETLSQDIQKISSASDTGDEKITNELKETREMVKELASTTMTIKSNVDVMLESDVNEFRLYLTQLHDKYINNNETMPRGVKQELRIKFNSYRKKGGNGWAEEMYNELMNIPNEPLNIHLDDF